MYTSIEDTADNAKVLFLNTRIFKTGYLILNCRKVNIAIIINPKIKVTISGAEAIPKVLALLNANKISPNPKVEYTTDILSKIINE